MDHPIQYLNDDMTGNTVLSTQLEWCLDTPYDSVTVYVCLYRLAYGKKRTRPFLSFWMEKSGDQYTFPAFTYSLADNEDEDEDEDEDAIDNSLKLACIRKLVDLRSLEQDLATCEHTTLGYKGLVSDKDVVFAVFDADELEKTFSSSRPRQKKCTWVILDEILRRKSVNGVAVDPAVTRMFQKHPILGKLRYNGQPIETPRQLYLVVVDPDTEESYTRHAHHARPAILELPHRFEAQFDQRFLLTETPLADDSAPQNPWTRYAAFIDQPVYVFDRETTTPEKRKQYADLIHKYSHTLEELEHDDEERMASNRRIPCISFSDRIGAHPPVDMWGLTQRNRFVEIAEE